MTQNQPDPPPAHSHFEQLEQALIDDFLRTRGYEYAQLASLPDTQRGTLLKEASVYASSRLAEVDSRWHLLNEIHGGVPGASKTGL